MHFPVYHFQFTVNRMSQETTLRLTPVYRVMDDTDNTSSTIGIGGLVLPSFGVLAAHCTTAQTLRSRRGQGKKG